MKKKHFLAIDLGATSGRSLLGTLENGLLETKEITRFPNQIVELHGRYYWNILSLYEHIKTSLFECAKRGIQIESIGIDTWGVDFVSIGPEGALLGMPRAYRDPYTNGVPEEFFNEVMPKEVLYGKTGIQVMNFNTLYQLYALKKSEDSALSAARNLLFFPDSLSYMLTGEKVTEYTIASTSQFLNPFTKSIDSELLRSAGINPALFPDMVKPGHIIGRLTDTVAEETGVGKVPVVAVAGHDTASAIAAVPVIDQCYAYLSSGTWSLMGIEVSEPIINSRSQELNFTNEGGVFNTIRFLKNITGLWLLECCRKEWSREGRNYSYQAIVQMIDSKTFHFFVDPDDPAFANPRSMTQAIKKYCSDHGFDVPASDAEVVRCIFESLAMKYRYTIEKLKDFAPDRIDRIHVIGGGANNDLLNQFTANSTGLDVIAGPSEATAIGNILIQAIAMGELKNLGEARNVVSRSVELKTYKPDLSEEWDNAYKVFLSKCLNINS